MSAKSGQNMNEKLRNLQEIYGPKREELKSIRDDVSRSMQERMNAKYALHKIPRRSAKSRYKNRCEHTGRARGYFREFGLCSAQLRESALKAEIPGLKKIS